MALPRTDAKRLIGRRHPEWFEWQRQWRFLVDSLEAGERYRHVDYTIDPTAVFTDVDRPQPWYLNLINVDPQTSESVPLFYNRICNRNLIPHLREMGLDGRAVYALRLHRTPVPQMVERAIESHLSKVYAREVTREGPTALQAWWEDVDGRGTPIDRWMRENASPLFAVLGQVDILFDHPAAPEGADIRSRADVATFGLDRCVASVILPENVVWWRLDTQGRYLELLQFERSEDHGATYKHWTATECVTYNREGDVVAQREHGFGRVPIVRVFDRRLVRCENVGRSRYASIASIQKAVYNLLSELILSDVQQSHAQLQGPAEYCTTDSEIPIGPDRILPMKPLVGASGFVSGYQDWKFLDPPKGAQQEVRQHILDLCDEADRNAALMKPAGQATGSTVAQSGISKQMDGIDGNAFLTDLAGGLEAAETVFAEMALTVLSDGEPNPADLAAVQVQYPAQFDLYSLSDLVDVAEALQRIAAGAGAMPVTETELMQQIVSLALKGIPPDRLALAHGEIEAFVAKANAEPEPEPEPVVYPMANGMGTPVNFEGNPAG